MVGQNCRRRSVKGSLSCCSRRWCSDFPLPIVVLSQVVVVRNASNMGMGPHSTQQYIQINDHGRRRKQREKTSLAPPKPWRHHLQLFSFCAYIEGEKKPKMFISKKLFFPVFCFCCHFEESIKHLNKVCFLGIFQLFPQPSGSPSSYPGSS